MKGEKLLSRIKKIDYSKKLNPIYIESIEANQIYINKIAEKTRKPVTWKVGKDNWVEFKKISTRKAVLNDSLFLRFMKRSIVRDSGDSCRDFIVVKFNYNAEYRTDDVEEKVDYHDLRTKFYKDGVTYIFEKRNKFGEVVEKKPIHYKMLMRSPGKAKEGHCIFVKTDLYKTALDYLTMGLYDKMPVDNAKIVEMSAYMTLITATAKDYITLPIDNIFVVEDQRVATDKKAVTVKTTDVQYQKKGTAYIRKNCYVQRDEDNQLSKIENVLWDGMGLIDDSIFPEGMEGFIYCRSHFFKSCLFRGDLQQYFKDHYLDKYNNATVTDMFGRKMYVKDIKVIITENSLKWIKFVDLMGGTLESAFKYYSDFMKKDGENFAIVKTAYHSKYDDLQRSSYQINNSLPTTDRKTLENIARASIDYINTLKLNDDAFFKHLKVTSTNYSINNVLLALDEWNCNFRYTKYFRDKKTDIISRLKKERVQLGKLFQYGDNLTICGNPIALLMQVTGEGYKQEKCFENINDGIQCYTTRFKEGENLAGFRSPHNAPNNIVHLKNIYPNQIKRYFSKLGDNVIIINGIGTDVQSRLNGQDLDTDFIYTTNQKDIVDLAKKAYLKFPTIINDIQSVENNAYKKDMESYAKMDDQISAAQNAIGLSSDIAQLALSYYFDGGMKDTELENVFIICSVLAQVSIDSAKRNFEIDVMPELVRIKNSLCMKKSSPYPRFFAESKNLKRRKQKRALIGKEDIKEYNCPMDILYQIIDEEVIDLRKHKKLNISNMALQTVFQYDIDIAKNKNRKQYNNITKMVNDYHVKAESLDITNGDYKEQRSQIFEECIFKLKNYKIKKSTMMALIAYAFSDDCKFGERLLAVLYGKSSDAFLSCFKKKEKSSAKIVKSA